MATQYTNGKPWIHQYGINSSANSANTKASAPNIAIATNEPSLVVAKNRVHLLGGWFSDGIVVYDQHAIIDSSGVIGSWAYTALGFSIASSDAVLIGGYVYTFGGYIGTGFNNASPSNIIKRSSVQGDGTLSSWSSYSTLPGVRIGHRCIITKGRLHTIGGLDASYNYLATTHSCPISEAGELGAWTQGPSLPYSIYGNFSVFIFGPRLYVVGGIVNSEYSRAIFSAFINTDGTIGEFSEDSGSYSGDASPLFFLNSDSSITTSNNVFVVSDGSDGTTPNLLYDDVWDISGANFVSDMDPWSKTQDLTYKRSGCSLCITSSRLYILGGSYNYSDQTIIPASTFAEYIPFSGGANDYTEWNSYTYLPADGIIEQLASEVSGSAINGSFIGVIDQPISEVSGLAKVYNIGYGVSYQPVSEISSLAKVYNIGYGIIEQPISEVLGLGLYPIYAYGDSQQDASEIIGTSYNSANPIFSIGIIEQGFDVSSLAINGVVLGQVEQPLSIIEGFINYPSVSFGKVSDYLSQLSGFSYSGIFIGYGDIEQPASIVSGQAINWNICNGAIVVDLSDVTGVAINSAVLSAVGQLEQELSTLQSVAIILSAAYGLIEQENDVIGYATCPNVGMGKVDQEGCFIHGIARYDVVRFNLEFHRCTSGMTPTILTPHPIPLTFSRCLCENAIELEPAVPTIPLSFSR